MNHNVEGEDIGVGGSVEGVASGGETTAFGVEESEVVGNISKVRNVRLDVNCV